MRLTTKLLVLVALLGAVSACKGRQIEEAPQSANQVEPLPEPEEQKASRFNIPFFNLGRNQDEATPTDPEVSEDPSITEGEALSIQPEQPFEQAQANTTNTFAEPEEDTVAQGTTVISESSAPASTASSATTGSSGTVVYEDNDPIPALW
ncbi:MAG: hypothetical protein F6K50_08330 [Moorea sp. SIO3I7]|nr:MULTISPECIES: hypothetical protein [unclassified Moorena]NEN95530.1 hypothetical protein [Moorena sp. SIO3I7]NEO09800.1 hypothetical protein [Moorena sp. SIO3I8]NEO18009.1 hypothetical protein [Moorena sp. SIO4A5]NEP22905.1 hypothetical protein [Moorena sp. SIO3I6]NEQ61343.1 hypothetical protein [Moorena sp. SIO4A1]